MKNYLIPLFVLISIGICIYSNSLHGEFQFDDKPFIVENTAVHSLNQFASNWSFYKTRLLGLYSFALNYHFHKFDVFGYHLVNLIIHIINSISVFWLLLLIFKTPQGAKIILNQPKQLFAFIVALFFLTHPLQTQAVAYITQRFESLATMFYLLSICTYLNWRILSAEKKANYIYVFFSALSALCAVFTKEASFTLPFIMMLIEYLFINDRGQPGKPNPFKAKYLVLGAVLAIVIFIPISFSVNHTQNIFKVYQSSSHDGDVFTSYTYLLTQFRVIVHYLSMLSFPVGQVFDYDFAISKSIFDLATFSSLLFLAVIFICGIIISSRHLLMAFGIFWFFITISITSSFIPIPHVIFEHRVYLPSIGFFISLVACLDQLVKNKRKFIILVALIAAIFSILTFERNKVWQNEIEFWIDNVDKSPDKARPYGNLAAAFIEKGLYAEAMTVLNLALDKGMDTPIIKRNLGEIHLHNNEPAKAKAIFEALIAASPEDVVALHGLAKVYLLEGNSASARELLIRATVQKGKTVYAALDLAKLWADLNEYDNAESLYKQIIEYYPGMCLEGYVGLGDLYIGKGLPEKAREIWGKGYQEYPKSMVLKERIEQLN